MSVSAVIPAAGEGTRIGAKKPFIDILGKPLIYYTLKPFVDSEYIDEIIIVAGAKDIKQMQQVIDKYKIKKIKRIVEGGPERQDSVYNGIQTASTGTRFIMIHDGARPLVTKELISYCVDKVKEHKAVAAGVPSKDTVKLVAEDRTVVETLDRDNIWLVQTPQVFDRDIIKQAYERARAIDYKATDDARLVERLGQKVRLIMGSYENIKVTTPEDVTFVTAVLEQRKSK